MQRGGAPGGVLRAAKKVRAAVDETETGGESASQQRMSRSCELFARMIGDESAELPQLPRTYECAKW